MSCSRLEYPYVTRYKFETSNPHTYKQTIQNNKVKKDTKAIHKFNIRTIEWPVFALGMFIGLQMIKE